MDLSVELFSAGEIRRVALEDLSRAGMFLQVTPQPAVGEPIDVAMYYEGKLLASPARVVHRLGEAEARALGRTAGIGIAFDHPTQYSDALFRRAVDRLLAHGGRIVRSLVHVVIADPDARSLERLSTELAAAGFSVATATNGLEALNTCMRRVPDVAIADRALPAIDGLSLVGELARRPQLRAVPLIVTSTDAADLGAAFDRGAHDFIHKPFATQELIGRCRRLARQARGQRPMLRGDLSALGLAALLVMLEQERKSGRLLLSGEREAWIDLAAGVIVGAGRAHERTPTTDPRALVMELLDWTAGSFELTPAEPTSPSATPLPVTYVLLEHARQCDERHARRAHA